MPYVDGFILPVPTDNLAAYRRMARKAGKIWREHGALEYIECLADDVQPGKHTSFPQSVKLKDGVSLIVTCDTQDEIDRLWTALTADGGAPVQCGWLKDKFGLPWQIVPRIVGDMMSDPDADRANRVMQALLQMTKLDIAALKQAYGHA